MQNICRLAIFAVFALSFSMAAAKAQSSNSAGSNIVPKEVAIDLGDGVTMELVWIDVLACWVGKYEVTNEEYRKYKADHDSGVSTYMRSGSQSADELTNKSLNGDRQPVVEVSYNDALLFCSWLSQKRDVSDGQLFRLPTGDEWTTFAQCGDGRLYPWGDVWPPTYGNYEFAGNDSMYDDDFDLVSCPVEQSGENEWGLFGVGGNVWEFTSDTRGEEKSIRGAAWTCGIRNGLEATDQGGFIHPTNHSCLIGFRVVLSLSEH